MILEEAAFVPPDLFYVVMVPLMGVDNTALLAISTPGEEGSNYYSELMDLKTPDGESLFRIKSVGLACDECAAANKSCPHVKASLPPWKSEARHAKTMAIMASRPEQASAELLGVAASATKTYLFRSYVRALHAGPCWQFDHNVNVVYIGIDPAGGTKHSDYAIFSVACESEHWVNLGADVSASYSSEEVNLMLSDHLSSLRENHRYRHALFVVHIEANYGGWLACDEIARRFSAPEYQPIKFPSCDPKAQSRIGMWTGPLQKETFAKDLESLLKQERLSYAQDYVSQRPGPVKAEFEAQLCQYRREVKPAADPAFTDARVTYTGKGGSRRDDLCMSAQICLSYALQIRQQPQFQRECAAYGFSRI